MKEVKFMRVAYERVSTAGQSTLRLEMFVRKRCAVLHAPAIFWTKRCFYDKIQ